MLIMLINWSILISFTYMVLFTLVWVKVISYSWINWYYMSCHALWSYHMIYIILSWWAYHVLYMSYPWKFFYRLGPCFLHLCLVKRFLDILFCYSFLAWTYVMIIFVHSDILFLFTTYTLYQGYLELLLRGECNLVIECNLV